MGLSEALIVRTERRGPSQMAGMGAGIGDTVVGWFDAATGGQLSAAEAQLARLETMLKVSIGASIVAGLAGLMVILDRRRS